MNASVSPVMRELLLLTGILAAVPVAGQDSVVLGRGVGNAFAALIECTDRSLCMDSLYVWELEAKHAVSGPPVSGRVKAIFVQHTQATLKFVRSVELFVLRRIDDPAMRKEYGADYSGIALSPRYSGSRYCLPVSPQSIGLKLAESDVSVDPDSGYYCFAKNLVR